MLCPKHKSPLQYFSVLKEESYFAEPLCNECLVQEKRLKFQVNYFLISSLENGLLAKQFESLIANILENKPSSSFHPCTLRIIEDTFEGVIKQIRTVKENFINDLHRRSVKFQSKSVLDLVKGLSTEGTFLKTDKVAREQLANMLVTIKDGIDGVKELSHQNSLVAFKIHKLQLQDFELEIKNALSKFTHQFTNQDYLKDLSLQAHDDVYHFSPNFQDLSQSPEFAQRDLSSKETLENFDILRTNNHPVLLTETLDSESRNRFCRLWDPKSLKPLLKYRNYENGMLPFILTKKKNYLIQAQNYNIGGPQSLYCLSISRLTSKGIKRIAKIVTRILSHIECIEEYNNIIGAEKLVLFSYNIFSRKCEQKFILTDTINVLKYVPHLNLLLVGGVQIYAYSIVKGLISSLKYTLEYKGSSLAQIQVDNIRNNLYCFHSDGLIRIWRLTEDNGSLLSQISVSTLPAEIFIFPDEQLLLLNSLENKVDSLYLNDQNNKLVLDDIDQILGLALDREGSILIIFQKGTKLAIKKIPTCLPVCQLK